MVPASRADIPRLLEEMQNGNDAAFDTLVPLVYDELRAMAHRQRRRSHGDDSLNTTALVHETYLKLVDRSQVGWSTRAHFLAVAARAMRHILINYSRHRHAQKRGGIVQTLSVDELDDPCRSISRYRRTTWRCSSRSIRRCRPSNG